MKVFLTVFLIVFVLVTWIMAWLKLSDQKKEQLALRSKSQLLENVMNQISDYVLILDQKGFILNTNTSFLDLIKRGEDKIIGKTVHHLHSNFDYNDHREKMKKSFSENSHYDFELDLFLKTGELVPLEIRARQYRIGEAIFHGLTCVNVKKSSERNDKILELKAELNEIQHLANTGYWEMNYETKKIYWSKELYYILGYDYKEVDPNLDFVHSMADQNDQSRVWKAFLDAFQMQEKVDTYYRLKNNRGETVDIFLRIRHFFSEKNEHLRTIGILQDISQRTKLKKEITNHQIFAESILNNSHLLYLSFTSGFLVQSINPLMSELTGLSPAQAKGLPLLDVFGDLNGKQRRFVNRNLDFKQPLPLKDKQEKTHYIQWNYATVTIKAEEVLNFLIGIDITETIDQRKALEIATLTDDITGLPNRKRLDQVLINYFDKNGKREDKPLTLICVQIGGIDLVADGCGQSVEDQVLKTLSGALNDRLKGIGLLAKRYFDQFTFFYPQGQTDKIDLICWEIIEIFKRKVKVDCCEIDLNPRIGIARFPKDAKNREDLIRFASAAMGKAKETNQGIVYFSQAIEEEIAEKVINLKHKR